MDFVLDLPACINTEEQRERRSVITVSTKLQNAYPREYRANFKDGITHCVYMSGNRTGFSKYSVTGQSIFFKNFS